MSEANNTAVDQAVGVESAAASDVATSGGGQGAVTSPAAPATDAAGKPRTRRRKNLSEKQMAILEVIQRSVNQKG